MIHKDVVIIATVKCWAPADDRIDDITPEEEAALESEALTLTQRTTRPPLAHSISTDAVPSPITFPTAAPSTTRDESATTTEEYMVICRAFIEQLRSGSAPWLLQRLTHTYGSMPEDPSEFSYWMALVSCASLPSTGLARAGPYNQTLRTLASGP